MADGTPEPQPASNLPAGTVPRPAMPSARPMMPPGPTAPAAVAPQSAGLASRRPILADLALKLLTEASRLGDIKDAEGQAILKALTVLSKAFGKPSGDLSRAETKMLGERAPMVSPANPSAFMAQMQQQAQGRVGAPPSPTPAPAGAGA
jgi:hypothetical protein